MSILFSDSRIVYFSVCLTRMRNKPGLLLSTHTLSFLSLAHIFTDSPLPVFPLWVFSEVSLPISKVGGFVLLLNFENYLLILDKCPYYVSVLQTFFLELGCVFFNFDEIHFQLSISSFMGQAAFGVIVRKFCAFRKKFFFPMCSPKIRSDFMLRFGILLKLVLYMM